jgi:hypothetical protein
MLTWSSSWCSCCTKGRTLFALDPRPPPAAFSQHIHSLPQRYTALLSRLQLDHSDLNASKHVLDLDDPCHSCPCGALETLEHALLTCGRYRVQRVVLVTAIGRAFGGSFSFSLPTLFLPWFTFVLLRSLHSLIRFPSLFAQLYPPLPLKKRPSR